MELVEDCITAHTTPGLRFFAGGKYLRAAVLLFSAQPCRDRPVRSTTDADSPAVRLAAAVEMVHSASLIHDDIIDDAARRRARKSLHQVLGTKAAVILADYLFVQGLALLESTRCPRLADELIREVRTMCEGQWLEMKTLRAGNCSEDRYVEIVEKKTAALFAFCARSGGTLRRIPARERSALGRFGRAFGMTFQLLDDAADGDVTYLKPRRGGTPGYLRRSADAFASSARGELASVSSPLAREGLGRMLDYLLEE